MRAAGFLDILFAFGYAVEVVTDADDFRHAAKESVKRFDHGWRKFYCPLLARDVRRIGVAHEPFGVRVEPNIEAMTLDSLDYLLRHAGEGNRGYRESWPRCLALHGHRMVRARPQCASRRARAVDSKISSNRGQNV